MLSGFHLFRSALSDEERCWKNLAIAIIQQAVNDLSMTQSRLDNMLEGDGGGFTEKDTVRGIRHGAKEWLLSPQCADLCDFIGIDHEALSDRVQSVVRRARNRVGHTAKVEA